MQHAKPCKIRVFGMLQILPFILWPGRGQAAQRFSLTFVVKTVSKIIKGKIQRSLTSFLTERAVMRSGYAKVSTQDQNLNLQRDALKKAAGCEKIIVETATGKSEARAGLEKLAR
jgi:hypothetical protein